MIRVDDPGDHRAMSSREEALYNSGLASLPTEEVQEATIFSEHPAGLDTLPTMIMPVAHVDVDRYPTNVQLPAIWNSCQLVYRDAIGGLPIEEQATWILPALSGVSTVWAPRSGSEVSNTDTENYVSSLRHLIKSSGIYVLSSLASPLVSLVLAPFLTHHLSHNDYGALAVLNTTIALMAGITQLGLGSAFFRAYNYDYESRDDRNAVLSTVIILLLLLSVPTSLLFSGAASWLSFLLFNSPALSNSLRLIGLIVLLQNLTVPGFAWLRAENRPLQFSLMSIINLLISLGANFALVGGLHGGITGSLTATALGYASVVLCTIPPLVVRAGLLPRFDVAKGLLSFGLPNVSTFISAWVLQLSDRLLLGRLGSLSQTASYAVAYSLGGIVSVVVLSPFTLAWPSVMYKIGRKKNAPQIFRLVFRWYGIVLLIATYGLSLVSIFTLYTLFPPAYRTAAPVIPIIALSMMFYGIYNMFTTGIALQRKIWFAALFTTIAALVNIGFNLILIPLYGSIGAALSTLFAYALLACVAYIVNQRIYPIPYEIGFFIFTLGVGIAIYIASNFFVQGMERYLAWGILISVWICYAISLSVVGKWFPGYQKANYL
jgi:O-antigen/teichoic acid export membrane protein